MLAHGESTRGAARYGCGNMRSKAVICGGSIAVSFMLELPSAKDVIGSVFVGRRTEGLGRDWNISRV